MRLLDVWGQGHLRQLHNLTGSSDLPGCHNHIRIMT